MNGWAAQQQTIFDQVEAVSTKAKGSCISFFFFFPPHAFAFQFVVSLESNDALLDRRRSRLSWREQHRSTDHFWRDPVSKRGCSALD